MGDFDFDFDLDLRAFFTMIQKRNPILLWVLLALVALFLGYLFIVMSFTKA